MGMTDKQSSFQRKMHRYVIFKSQYQGRNKVRLFITDPILIPDPKNRLIPDPTKIH